MTEADLDKDNKISFDDFMGMMNKFMDKHAKSFAKASGQELIKK